MKRISLVLLFIAFLLLSLDTVKAQSLDVDASGKSTLLFNGASAIADIPRGYFGASYYNIPDNEYFRRSPIFGVNASGSHRNGLSGLLNSNLDAMAYNLYFTMGLAFTSEYPAKLKSLSEYEEMLKEEKIFWERDSLDNFFDTVFLFREINKIAIKHPKHADTLKLVYFKHGPTNNLKRAWHKYAKNVAKTEDNNDFLNLVNQLIIDFDNGDTREDYKKSTKYLSRINYQLLHIKTPAQPFSQTNLFLDLGITGTSFSQATYTPIIPRVDSIVNFSTTNFSRLYFGIGLNHFSSNKFCIGIKLGVMGNDNFEQLSAISYDSSAAINGNKSTTTQTYNGYYGTYRNKLEVYASLSLNYINKVEKLGHVIFTPLYVTASTRRTYGTSLSLITNKRVLIGVNLEGVGVSENAFYVGSPAYNNFSFGFRLGYLFSDFSFAR